MRKEEDKKVSKDTDQEIIEITADVRVGEYILEKGDKIVILEAKKKEQDDEDDDMKDKDDDDTKDDKDDDDDDDEKDEKKKKEAILRKISKGRPLTTIEKRFVIRNF